MLAPAAGTPSSANLSWLNTAGTDTKFVPTDDTTAAPKRGPRQSGITVAGI
jgi:hypothetical protein